MRWLVIAVAALALAAPASASDGEVTIAMHGPGGARAVVRVLPADRAGRHDFALIGSRVPANGVNTAYAVWLYSDANHAVRLGFTQPVGRDGRLETSGTLPRGAGRYRELLLTLERNERAKIPGRAALRGTLVLPHQRAG